MNARTTVPLPWLRDAILRVFQAAGLSDAAAAAVTESLLDAELRGVSSHGPLLVPMYIERLLAGSVSRHEQAQVVSDTDAVAVLDARHALGVLTSDQAMKLAVAKARVFGVGAVAVRHAFHFGAASRYVTSATRAGCIGVAAANTRPLMPAPGGAEPVVGNNPLAIGVPGRTESLVLDMALSEAALGKIRLAAEREVPIPDTWATGPDGRATTDPALAMAGMLLPAGGPKGFGLALMVDVLAGVLTDGGFGDQVRGLYADTAVPNDCAHFFLAIDVAAFGDLAGFQDRVARLVESVRGSRTAPGVDRVRVPGQPEAERYAAALAAGGIDIDQTILTGLEQAAEVLGTALPARMEV